MTGLFGGMLPGLSGLFNKGAGAPMNINPNVNPFQKMFPQMSAGFEGFQNRINNPLTQLGLGVASGGMQGQGWGQGVSNGLELMGNAQDRNKNALFEEWLKQRMLATSSGPTGLY